MNICTFTVHRLSADVFQIPPQTPMRQRYVPLMKRLITIGFIGLTSFSCGKKDKYVHFDERQLVFVNYLKGARIEIH